MNYEREFNRMIVNKNRHESEFSPLRNYIKNYNEPPYRLQPSMKPTLESSHLPYDQAYCSIYKSSYKPFIDERSRSSDKYSDRTSLKASQEGFNNVIYKDLQIKRDPCFEIKAKGRVSREFPVVGQDTIEDRHTRYMQMRVRNEYIKNRMDGYGRDCIS